MRKILNISALGGLFILVMSCTTSKKLMRPEQILQNTIDTSQALSTGFTGVHIVDLQDGTVIFSRNASRYFTPASNTKLFTLYASINYLGDSIPAIKYTETDSTFTFWGTGDPTFLHSMFVPSGTLDFLKSKATTKKMFQSYGHADIKHYGEGWMWDDFNDYYQPEIASFPAYGNVLTIRKDSTGISGQPMYLMQGTIMTPTVKQVKRSLDYNQFLLPTSLDTLQRFYQEIPYKDAETINRQILERDIGVKINPIHIPVSDDARFLYSIAKDTVLRRMMLVSDNMLAEQLLILTGMNTNDTVSTTFSIQNAKDHLLKDLINPPLWVDGSGLSNYNLMTPQSITQLLKKLYQSTDENRLFSFMAVGGQSGTLMNMFNGKEKPYIYAKTGSLSGVYNLSGYMITSSGRKLIFSFMNNNFSGRSSAVRKEVERILNLIWAQN